MTDAPVPDRRHEISDDAIAAVERALRAADVPYETPEPGAFLVTMPGERKHSTLAWLRVGRHSLLLHTFFCRRPDENPAEFYLWLLRRNREMYGVHFASDDVGDVYLLGRVALHSITDTEIDRLLGCVLAYSDENFNTALELGFASAIRREWAWRESRGASLRNLSAFKHLIDADLSGG
ncbi:type III secretion system chaperone family protein [Spiractinospora alimapuensis]|uniref:YbjN domain-containing protein n=1 Tax=Spiractinospora alimapuensis TaxID=2820884 RepID=UPI001F28D0E3|nr:YbjN domain-containing protein [Spiractinospora alimapuensis]